MSAISASKVLVPSAETPQKSLERSALNASVCLFLNASHADFSKLVIVASFAANLPDFAGLAWPKQKEAIATKAIQQRTNCFFMTVSYSNDWIFVESFRIADAQFGDRQVPMWRRF